MSADELYPTGTPIPRVDSFEVIEPGGPELTDEEKAWPVVALHPRSDSFEVIEPAQPVGELEVVIRVRCAASATPAEVRAFADQLRSAVEGVRPPTAGPSAVQVSLPVSAS